MSLVTLRTAIVAGINTGLPSLRDCSAHGGRFSLKELKATAAKAPAVRVACLGINDFVAVPAGVEAMTVWGAFVITRDQPGVGRDAVALTLLAALGVLVPANCWGKSAIASGAVGVRGDNLFSSEIDAQGVALWALTWRHQVTLGTADLATLDDWLRCYVDYDLAAPDGVIDASDHINTPGPWPE